MAVDQHTIVTKTEPPPNRLPGPEVLAAELATYEANRQELLQCGAGQCVLVKGSEIVGLYPTSDEAYEAGLARFGLTPFMIREVRERDISFSWATPHVPG
jgi:hypothetical protein